MKWSMWPKSGSRRKVTSLAAEEGELVGQVGAEAAAGADGEDRTVEAPQVRHVGGVDAGEGAGDVAHQPVRHVAVEPAHVLEQTRLGGEEELVVREAAVHLDVVRHRHGGRAGGGHGQEEDQHLVVGEDRREEGIDRDALRVELGRLTHLLEQVRAHAVVNRPAASCASTPAQYPAFRARTAGSSFASIPSHTTTPS
jgi:hypothetical protein